MNLTHLLILHNTLLMLPKCQLSQNHHIYVSILTIALQKLSYTVHISGVSNNYRCIAKSIKIVKTLP